MGGITYCNWFWPRGPQPPNLKPDCWWILTCQPDDNICVSILWKQCVQWGKESFYFDSEHFIVFFHQTLVVSYNNKRKMILFWKLESNITGSICRYSQGHAATTTNGDGGDGQASSVKCWCITWIKKPRQPVNCWTTDNDVEVEHRLLLSLQTHKTFPGKFSSRRRRSENLIGSMASSSNQVAKLVSSF